MRKRLPLIVGTALVLLAQTSWCQRIVPWRVYKMADGLNEPACSSVTLGSRGRILGRQLSQNFLVELDGFEIRNIPAPEGAQPRAFQSPGGQIWTASTNGLYEYRAGTWVFHALAEIQTAFRTNAPPRTGVPLWPVRQGVVVFMIPSALAEFNLEPTGVSSTRVILPSTNTSVGTFTGMSLARGGGLWISGSRGLVRMSTPSRFSALETPWEEFRLPDSLGVTELNEPREDEAGGVTLVAKSSHGPEKVIVRFDGREWRSKPSPADDLLASWRSSDRVCWAIDPQLLFEGGESGMLAAHEEFSARQYFDVAVEPRGTFWLATSDGLYRYAPALWRTPREAQKLAMPVHGMTADNREGLWFVAGSNVYHLRESVLREFSFPVRTSRTFQNAQAAFAAPTRQLVLELGGELLSFDLDTERFGTALPGSATESYRGLGNLRDEGLCVQRVGGQSTVEAGRLHLFDGKSLRSWLEVPGDLAIGTIFISFFAARDGDLWLSGERGVAVFHEGKWQSFASSDNTTPLGGAVFAELADGRIWCATSDRIWEYDGRNWSVVRGGFDRIQSILRARDGSVWVASNSGLSRFVAGAWVDNGTEEGLPGPGIRDVLEDARGRIWAATAYGLSSYFPEADPDPPQTTIADLGNRERNLPENAAITISFEGRDKWKFTSRHRLLFSYRLDEQDWSPFGEQSRVVFSDLPAGKHYFQVRSMDRNGNVDPKPASMDFAVVVPWYKEGRLVAITAAGLAMALFFAGLAFNRHRRLLRSYAEVENKIAQRTQELEMANRELFQSQKMTAMGTLAAGIAHDFNNILSIIKGSAQIIEDNLANAEKVRIRVDRIKTVVDQGAGIVKAMLGFSRDSSQPSNCDLNEVARDTVMLLGDRFLREVQVTVRTTAKLPRVRASKDLIQQILLNFIFNAAEAITERKEVIVATSEFDRLPQALALAPPGSEKYVAVSVRDFGCGIPPENLSRIFEPFFTTKAFSSRRGTGLGLSMAYQMAQRLEAGLAVESAVGEGSTFTLMLPALPEPETRNV